MEKLSENGKKQIKMNNFVPLHLHTTYSILDGAIRIEQLAEHLVSQGINSCAITDHGWMGGVLHFQKVMKKNGIKSIIGVEFYITENPDNSEQRTRDNLHLVALAKNNEGIRKLFRLISEAALHNFYYKPRVYQSKLASLAPDVVITTACIGGVLRPHISERVDEYGVYHLEPLEPLHTIVKQYQEWFRDDFYLEVQGWDDETHLQSEYNQVIINMARIHSIPLVITADSHYLTREDYKLHQIMMALQTGQTLEQYLEGSSMRYGDFFHVASGEEMIERANQLGIPEAVSNTIDIAAKCNAEIPIGTYFMPTYGESS